MSQRMPDYESLRATQARGQEGHVGAEKPPEVRYVELTSGEKVFDEVVAQNAYVHLEAMDDNHWWMIITSGGQSVRVNLYTKRAKIITDVDVEDE